MGQLGAEMGQYEAQTSQLAAHLDYFGVQMGQLTAETGQLRSRWKWSNWELKSVNLGLKWANVG